MEFIPQTILNLMVIVSTISIVSTTMLTLDRFLYITTTLQYHSIMTPRVVVVSLLVCWLLPAVNSVVFVMTFR